MAGVPWWYAFVREWRQRAFLETWRWPQDIHLTNGDALDGLPRPLGGNVPARSP